MTDYFEKVTAECGAAYRELAGKMEGILPSTLCFESLLAWEKACHVSYQIVEDYFCVLVQDTIKKKQYLYMPIGQYQIESLERLMDKLFAQQGSFCRSLLFCDVAEEQLEYLKQLKGYRIRMKSSRGYSDYIYSMEDFEKSLSASEARYNRNYFIRKYRPECRSMNSGDGPVCDAVVERSFCQYHDCRECVDGCLKDTIGLLLENYDDSVVKGVMVQIGELSVGYAVGVLQGDTFVFLFKKNCREYRGLSEYLHWKIAELVRGRAQVINYTEDMNLEGLRKYKEKLAPYQLRPKYKVEVERLR